MRELLWSGKIIEVEPPKYGKPLVWFDCDYDSGLLAVERPHLLVLDNPNEFPGKVGQRFALHLESEPFGGGFGGDVILFDGIRADVEPEIKEYTDLYVPFDTLYHHPCMDDVFALTLEKGAAFPGKIGDRFRLILQLED